MWPQGEAEHGGGAGKLPRLRSVQRPAPVVRRAVLVALLLALLLPLLVAPGPGPVGAQEATPVLTPAGDGSQGTTVPRSPPTITVVKALCMSVGNSCNGKPPGDWEGYAIDLPVYEGPLGPVGAPVTTIKVTIIQNQTGTAWAWVLRPGFYSVCEEPVATKPGAPCCRAWRGRTSPP